jgi:hypothetical protein
MHRRGSTSLGPVEHMHRRGSTSLGPVEHVVFYFHPWVGAKSSLRLSGSTLVLLGNRGPPYIVWYRMVCKLRIASLLWYMWTTPSILADLQTSCSIIKIK